MAERFTELESGDRLVMCAGGHTIVVTMEKKSGRRARLRIEAGMGIGISILPPVAVIACDQPVEKTGTPKMLAG